jgi:hypothetical protein
VSPVRYELGFYNPEDDILHGHRRENLKSEIFSLFVSNFVALLRGSTEIVRQHKIRGGGNILSFFQWAPFLNEGGDNCATEVNAF